MVYFSPFVTGDHDVYMKDRENGTEEVRTQFVHVLILNLALDLGEEAVLKLLGYQTV